MICAAGKLGCGIVRGSPVRRSWKDFMKERSRGAISWWSESESMDWVIRESVVIWVMNTKTRGLGLGQQFLRRKVCDN